MQNVILHTNSILTTTTTKMLHLIYEYNPPKRISKFENNFLSGISTNTWQAGYQFEPIPHFSTWPWSNFDPSAPWSLPLTSPHQFPALPAPPLAHHDNGMTMPWHGMAIPCPLSPLSPQ
jgi:hypothetical protein